MSCISSNFSSFFLNSLNDSSEFAKYLSNGELRFSSFEDFQAFGSDSGGSACTPPPPTAQSHLHPTSAHQVASQLLPQQHQHYYNGVGCSNNNTANVIAGANTTPGVAAPNASDSYSGVMGQQTNGIAMQNLAETTNSAIPTSATQPVLHPTHHQAIHPSHVPHSHHAHHAHTHHAPHPHPYAGHASSPHTSAAAGGSQAATNAFHHNHHLAPHLTAASAPASGYPTTPTRWPTSASGATATPNTSHTPGSLPIAGAHQPNANANPGSTQHFDGSFEFLKYLRHSNDYNNVGGGGGEGQGDAGGRATTPQPNQSQSSSLIDLDSSTATKSRSSLKAAALLSSVSRASNNLDAANSLDVFDHDSKHTIFDMQHVTATNSSNSNESSLEVSNLAFPNSHLNGSNSNTSSEGAATGSSDFAMLQSGAAASAPKPLATFTIKDNFDVHPSHKVEEGIFQHMNKLPAKKKENLKQLGVRFTGQMTLSDKSIVVENFVKFCQEYDVQDHRPFLSLNQSGLNKADQIKFARYLGQGLPTFTLFCIYSNFKNLFCTKRTEIYTKDGYNLPYILDKTKRFLSSTTAGNTPNKANTNSLHSQTNPVPSPAPQTQPHPQPQPSQHQLPPQARPLLPPSHSPLPPQHQPQPHPHPHSPLTHPLQSQPLQPQPPKPTLQTQTMPQPQLMMHTPPPSQPPNHLQQLQQHTAHIPMQISRGVPK